MRSIQALQVMHVHLSRECDVARLTIMIKEVVYMGLLCFSRLLGLLFVDQLA